MSRNNKSSNVVNQIFDDLEGYRNFCRDFGYRFDEADLYNNKSYVYRQFNKFLAGKPVKDQWEIDSKVA
jgi:hypothetical protein